jgi:mannose-6-phosphate isomerase-like protein (cupin superfamily)
MTSGFLHSRPDGALISIPQIGLELRVRVSPGSTGGALSAIETTNAPGFGPPLQRHRETEIFYVLEGQYLFEVDGQRFHAEPGDVMRNGGPDPQALTAFGVKWGVEFLGPPLTG